MSARSLNRRLKSTAGWVALLFVVVAALAVGATRDTGPQSAGDRVDAISRRIACPECDGESVYESRSRASEAIRTEIRAQVNAGRADDDQIIEFVAERFGGQVLLVPRSTGIEALAWALPAAALVVGVTALFFAFRRWRLEAAGVPEPTDDDIALVAEARAAERE
ncbi:MAG: cytochrome c-type biogenesis protein CcmH [Ilumatobacteraceae bacterium]|nr:cytochrome c-type biogenesis protein CcmH [Ilumatobacteraceae bacterium]